MADRRRVLMTRRAVGFGVALTLVLALALSGGGYDIVVRQEAGLAVWALLCLGLATGVLPRAELSTPGWVALAGIAGLAFLALLAHSWTASDERTSAELARVVAYLGIVAAAYLALNRHTWQGAAAGIVTAAVVVVSLAVLSRISPLFTDDVSAILDTDRLSYPLGYWNAVSCWGAMTIAICLGLAAHSPRPHVRVAALSFVPVAALSVYLTYSRFGVAATMIAVAAVIALGRHRWTTAAMALVAGAATAFVIAVTRGQDEIARGTGSEGGGVVLLALGLAAVLCAGAVVLGARLGVDRVQISRRRSRQALVAAGVGMVLAGAALSAQIESAWDEFRGEDAAVAASDPAQRLSSLGGTRYSIWTGAVDAFEADSLRGVGPGGFESYWSREGEGSQFIRDAHSLYLEQLAELGVPGLLALMFFFVGLVVAAMRGRRRWSRDRDLALGAGLLAAFLVFAAYAAVDWVWEMTAVGAFALGAAAVAGAGGHQRRDPRQLAAGWRVALAALALVAAASQVPGLVSTQRVRAAQSALELGDAPEAQRLATEAVRAQPWAATPYATQALVSERQGRLGVARARAREAIEHEPADWRHYLLLARIEAQRGDRAATEKALAQARARSPRSPFLVEGAPFLVGIESLLSRAGA